MYGIDILIEEHDIILECIEKIRASSREILDGKDVDIERFREYIDFVRDFADNHHHGKEEKILFKIMVDNLSPLAEKLINYGMLVEHDLGRLFIANLEEALNLYEKNKDDDLKLDIIANAIGYGDLLKRHIEKENKVVFSFAERELNDELKGVVDKETLEFERENSGVREKFENVLKRF